MPLQFKLPSAMGDESLHPPAVPREDGLPLEDDFEHMRRRMDALRQTEALGEQPRHPAAIVVQQLRGRSGQGQNNLMGRLAQLHGQQHQLLQKQLELFRCAAQCIQLAYQWTPVGLTHSRMTQPGQTLRQVAPPGVLTTTALSMCGWFDRGRRYK